MALLAVLAALLILPHSPAFCREPRRDPSTGRISILYYGDAFGPSPYPTFVADPLTSVAALTGMSGTQQKIDKKMRIYTPRNYQDLLAKYDLIIMSDALVKNFRPFYINWFRDSVIHSRLGLIMISGYGSFGGGLHFQTLHGVRPFYRTHSR